MKQVQNFEKIQTSESIQTKHTESFRHFGQTLPIGILPNGQPKYVLGPHFFVLTVIITSVLFTILGFNIASQARDNKLIISLAITFTMLFYIYSYIKVGFSNPGLASSSIQLQERQRNNVRYCHPCKIIRPIGTVHCYSCDVCIHGYDHHCPWIGKCVGKNNMCDFKRFLFSISLAIITFAICVYKNSTITTQNTS